MPIRSPARLVFLNVMRSVACLVLLVLAACATPTAAPSTPTAPPRAKIRAHFQPLLSFAPLAIAQAEGYFAEQGLDVEFVRMGSTADATPGLISGDLDVLAGPINLGLLNAMAQREAIRFVADKGYLDADGCVTTAFVTRRVLIEEGRLTSLKQLRGLKLSINPTSYVGYLLAAALEKSDGSFDELTFLNLKDAEERAALEQGSLDMAEFGEPALSEALKDPKLALWLSFAELAPDSPFSLIIYGPRLVKQAPELGERFMVAYLKAVRQYNQGKTPRNLEIISEYTQLDAARLQEICWAPIRSDGAIDPAPITRFQEWGFKRKLLDNVATPDQFWDPRFITYAQSVLDRKP